MNLPLKINRIKPLRPRALIAIKKRLFMYSMEPKTVEYSSAFYNFGEYSSIWEKEKGAGK